MPCLATVIGETTGETTGEIKNSHQRVFLQELCKLESCFALTNSIQYGSAAMRRSPGRDPPMANIKTGILDPGIPHNHSSLLVTSIPQPRMKATTFVAAASAPVSYVLALSSKVSLDYATYQGTAGLDGITRFLGMQYAAPPIGDLRWKAPQDPTETTTAQSAAKVGSHAIIALDSYANSHTVQGCMRRSQPDSRNRPYRRLHIR
jgi:hypothetical protein